MKMCVDRGTLVDPVKVETHRGFSPKSLTTTPIRHGRITFQ